MADEPLIPTSQVPAAEALGGNVIEPAPQPQPTAAPVEKPAEAVGDVEAGAPAQPVEAPSAPEPVEPPKSLLALAAAELEKTPEPIVEPPVEPLKYEFTFPDGVQADAQAMEPFIGFLTEHNLAPEQGQRLIDLHLAEIERAKAQLTKHQIDVFHSTREAWRNEVIKDPELGGNRIQTTINGALGFMRHYASNADHYTRLIQKGEVTGWNDDPDFIRLMWNASQGLASLYREPAPVVPMKPAVQPQARYSRRYGTTDSR